MTVQRSWSGSPWEVKAGYCRAVRVGGVIKVAATAPFGPDGDVMHVGDLAGQTTRCLEIILDALAELGGQASDVVVTRMYVTDISRTSELAEPHRLVFGAHPPAATLVEVAGLVHPDILIEIEAEAVVLDVD